MPIVIRAKKNQSTSDVIRQFKKAVSLAGVVQIAKDRRYFQKPSRIKSAKTAERSRLKRRAHSLKKMKNISASTIAKIQQRLGS
ncbi:30S ribosomal protein S21 [bioreactor metagenome]|jgi:ribosomal protein S21|uniref:30S ribosomal protein S21 n=1 Tax=bioreactor metagenome TaxID=1076179 RepID=A0A645EJY2_9ZZZZ